MKRDYGINFYGAQLPPHISLKQPFLIADLNEVEDYFDKLAYKTKPLEIVMDHAYHHPPEDPSGLFLNVRESAELKQLHNQINKELAERFENTSALFDGDDYHFHATIALGVPSQNKAFREYFETGSIAEPLSYIANEMVMFYYDDDNYKLGTFMTYKILPMLGQQVIKGT